MNSKIRVVLTGVTLAGASLMLAACGGSGNRVAASRPVARQAPEPLPSSGGAAVWNLRAGLNVAALSCRGRGRQPVANEYARMLARHRALLASAYRQEQGRHGVSTFDRQQTRLYNTFANQRSPARFCTTASSVAHRANGLDSSRLATAAPDLFGELRASLR